MRIFYSDIDYHIFNIGLLRLVQSANIKYDAVITMPRGGLGVGAVLAEGLKVDISYVQAQSYGEAEKAEDVHIK